MLKSACATAIAVAVVASLATPPWPATAQYGAVCPVFGAAPPPGEGQRAFILVAQPNPCPPPNRTQSNFAIRIDFGDGTVVDTTYAPDSWLIGAEHAYRRAGSFLVRATVTDKVTGAVTGYERGPLPIDNAALTAGASPRPRFTARRRATRSLVRFQDANPLARPGDYRIRVAWGDGRSSRGTAVRRGQSFVVRGAHRYRRAGIRTVRVAVDDGAGGRLELTATARVAKRRTG